MAFQLPLSLFLLVLLPAIATCIRPFRVPKTLFVQGTSPFTEPEGVHVIRREVDEHSLQEDPEELREEGLWIHKLRSRVRRDAAGPTGMPPMPFQSNALANYDTLYAYWPSSVAHENFVFVLATNSKDSKSTVMVSTNHGQNWTSIDDRFTLGDGSPAFIDKMYVSKVNPTLCMFADKVNKRIFISSDLSKLKFNALTVTWEPSYITFHPWNERCIMGFDSKAQRLYWSNNKGRSFYHFYAPIVKSFQWGVKGVDSDVTVFVENLKTKGGKLAEILQYDDCIATKTLIDNVEEFELKENYLFVTIPKTNTTSPKMLVSYNRKLPFQEAKFPLTEENRDFFVFDVTDDFVFVVINHRQNSSNMYLSEKGTGGLKYQLSLERVLYHNPFTDVSSPWLRSVIPYAFVDVARVKAMQGTYIATQLTPGPVGKRHLLSLITYNRGGRWQRIPTPGYDNRGVRINCYLPDCSLHVNLQYGAVYRVSPSQQLLSSDAAPGLVVALGVASTNLKIYPDLYLSLDGAVSWKRVLRGKHLFAIGDHGGIVIAVPFRRYTRTLRFSIDGGRNWKNFVFHTRPLLAQRIVTQPGERLPIFLIYGNVASSSSGQFKSWLVFSFNMTSVLGQVCDSSGYANWTDGCLLGQQQQFESRNYSISCRTGRNYTRPKFVKNCPCSRDDFECDYGFQRKAYDEECTPIPGEDLDKEIIPDNCPEGTMYNRTQGFRKIPGDTCFNGTQADFLPKLTPCPVKELVNLTLSSTSGGNKDGIISMVTGSTVSLNASLAKGFYPNIIFRWYFGDGHTADGTGKAATIQNHLYSRPGRYVVSVVATNLRSTLVEKIELYVQEKIDKDKVMLNYHPMVPGVKEDVTLFASVNYSYEDVGIVKYKWIFEGVQVPNWQPVAVYRFSKSGTYQVLVTVSNLVSIVTKKVDVQVTKDLLPVNVTAQVLSPTKILVKWKHSAEADKYVKQYKIYKSTSSNEGYALASTVDRSNASCAVDNLTPATTYYFKVQAWTDKAKGPFSQIAIATTTTSTPGAPDSLMAYALNATAVTVSWKVPTRPNGKITSYTIRYWSSSQPVVQTLDNGLSLSRTLANLQPNTFYMFEVFANTKDGRGIAAGPKQVHIKLSKPILPPRNIQKVSDNGTCAMFTWDPPYLSTTDTRPFSVKGYKASIGSREIDIRTTHQLICKLFPSSKYNFTVWAYSELGPGPKGSISFSTQITKAGAPKNLQARPLSPSEIRLEWGAPAQAVTGYLVYQVSPFTDSKPIPVDASQTSYTVQNLQPYTAYRFNVLAKNSLGLGVRSPTVTATTLQSRPEKVEFVTAEVVTPFSASIKLTWTRPSKPNGVITQYKIEWGKVIPDKIKDLPQITLVPGTETSYTFKHLYSGTFYAFAVTPRSDAGEGINHLRPIKERTVPALKGTERLRLKWAGPQVDEAAKQKDFIPNFIKAASVKANIIEDRIAAVDVVWEENTVDFDVISPLNQSDIPVEQAKSALQDGFDVSSQWQIKPRTLRSIRMYSGDDNGGILPTGGQPSAAAQRDAPQGDNQKTILGIAIPLALIGIVLLAGMVFFYLKYKSIEQNYKKMDGRYHQEDDEMKVVYHEDMQADSPDVIFSEDTRRGKKFYKDAEKIPLGESDELAMI